MVSTWRENNDFNPISPINPSSDFIVYCYKITNEELYEIVK